jgi:prophage regulatory protein
VNTSGLQRPKKSKRLLDRKEVLARVPLSYPTIWDMMQKGTFPRGRAVGDQKVCWLESDIDDFIDGLPVKKLKGDDATEAAC